MPARWKALTISLNSRTCWPGVRGVGRLGGEEGQRRVAPVILERLARHRVDAGLVQLVELQHRHQLDGRHAERLQIRDFLAQAQEGAGVPDLR